MQTDFVKVPEPFWNKASFIHRFLVFCISLKTVSPRQLSLHESDLCTGLLFYVDNAKWVYA